MTISMDKKYKTRDGRDVRLLCVDKPGNFPVVAIVGPRVTTFTEKGQYDLGLTTPLDLIEVPKEYFRTIEFTEDKATIEDCKRADYPTIKLGGYVAESADALRQRLVGATTYTHIAVLNEQGRIIRIEEF